MKFFGGMLKTAMENSGFDANQKFLFGSNRILESFGLNNGNNGGNNSSNASNGALSGDIQAASKWAESMVGHTGYGGNGCTEFVKNYLLHANSQLGKYMQDCSPIMDQVKKAAANNGDKPYETLMWVPTLYEWAKEQNMLKGPDQPGAEGDVCICNDIGHVVIADGKGGFWGNSSSRNQIIHSNSISQTFTIQGYIPTGSGSGTVSNDKKVLTAAQSNAEAGATNNAASGKHGRYGRGLPAYVEDFDTANSMDAVNVPFDIKSAASKDNFKTSMYGMRRHRKRLSSAPDTQKAIPKIEDFKQEDNNNPYTKIFSTQDAMFGNMNSIGEIKEFINSNYDTSKIPDYNMIKDDDDLFVAKSKAANIVKQYTKIPGMGKGKYGRGLGGFISKAKNLFSKAKDIWNKIKPYKDKISSLFHHKKKDNKSTDNDTKKDPKQLEEEYLKAHLITADVESMKTKDEIKNAIKDIPEDSILEYNKITDEDDLTVAKAKAKKTIELYNEEVRKKAKEYAANGGEDKSKTNESNAESSDKKEEPVVDEIAPNGEHYTKNDVDYLLSKGYTREAAIELLSKDKKYTTKKKDGKNEEVVEEIAPNGEHYSKNDVDYLMNNGYSREAAIALLSKDKKYTEKPEEKQEEKKKLNRRITDTYADDYDTPEERQKAREENDAKLKAEKEAKEKEKKNRSSKDKDEEVVEEVAPNGEHYSKNDVDYLLSKGYSRQAAIELLSKDKKYTEKPKDKKDKKTSKYAAEVAPNGKHYTNNDIQYLLDKGYSRQAAIELLSKDKKYTESTDEDDEEDEDEESDNDSKKTRRHRHRRRRLNTRITDTRSDDEENASEKQLEKNEKRLRRRIRHRRSSKDEDYDEDEDLEDNENTKKSNKYCKVKAPNGEYYETNDIKYLTDHGYSEKAAIELLSKDKKYTTKKYHHKRKYSKIQAPNGEYYSNNDIDYLMNNGYTKKAAIELLSKDKKYNTKKDDRKTAIEKIGDNASSVTKVSTSTADAKAAEENQKLKPIDVNVDNLRTKEEFDEALKDIPEDKILEYNKIQDGDDILVMRAKAKKTIALYNAYVKDHNDKIDKAEAEKKDKEANNKDAKTPNKEESKKEEAVSVGKKDEDKDSKNKGEKSKTKEFEYKDGKKHNMKLSDKVAPNGMHFLQNDIDYLVNKGYSEDDAIALLSEDPRYKEESDKTNNDNNGDSTPSGAVSAKTKENKKSKIDDLIAKQEETNKLLAAILQIATQYVGNTAAAPANNPKVNANETKNVNTGEVGSDIHSIKSALSKKYGGSKFGLGDGYMRQSTGRSYETIFHSLDLISTR